MVLGAVLCALVGARCGSYCVLWLEALHTCIRLWQAVVLAGSLTDFAAPRSTSRLTPWEGASSPCQVISLSLSMALNFLLAEVRSLDSGLYWPVIALIICGMAR